MMKLSASIAPVRAPLWAAAHLPHKGGDHTGRLLLPLFWSVGDWRKQSRRPISPLVGEMGGSPEGGAKELYVSPGGPR